MFDDTRTNTHSRLFVGLCVWVTERTWKNRCSSEHERTLYAFDIYVYYIRYSSRQGTNTVAHADFLFNFFFSSCFSWLVYVESGARIQQKQLMYRTQHCSVMTYYSLRIRLYSIWSERTPKNILLFVVVDVSCYFWLVFEFGTHWIQFIASMGYFFW